MEEVLNLLQERVNETYGKYMEQVETKKRLDEECKELQEEKKALMTQLESEQGNLGEYTERQQKACAALKDLEVALVDAGNKLIEMEQARIEATQQKKDLESNSYKNLYPESQINLQLVYILSLYIIDYTAYLLMVLLIYSIMLPRYLTEHIIVVL